MDGFEERTGLEKAWGEVAVKRVASAAERDIVCGFGGFEESWRGMGCVDCRVRYRA